MKRTLHTYRAMRQTVDETVPSVFTTYQVSGKPIAPSSDLRHFFGPIEDQGPLGSCTAFAALQWLAALRVQSGYPWVEYSELAQYYQERLILGDTNDDTGAFNTTAVQVLEQFGAMPEADDPYVPANFRNAPPNDWDATLKITPAQAQAITEKSMDMVNAMRDALSQGHIPMAGWVCYPELESAGVASSGVLPMPAQGEQPIGGHETVFVGHDDNITFPVWNGLKGAFLVRNQWSQSWGQQGYFWMPYDYAAAYIDEMPVVGFAAIPVTPPTPIEDNYTVAVSLSKNPFAVGEQIDIVVTTTNNEKPFGSDDAKVGSPILHIGSDSGELPTFLPDGTGGLPWNSGTAGDITFTVTWTDPLNEAHTASVVGTCVAAPPAPPTPTPVTQYWRVQVGAYSEQSNAVAEQAKVHAAGFPTYVRKGADGLWHVQVGAYSDKQNALNVEAQLKTMGFDTYLKYE